MVGWVDGEGFHPMLQGVFESVAEHGGRPGELGPFGSGGVDDGLTGLLVLGELINHGAQAHLDDGCSAELADGDIDVGLGCGSLGWPGPPAAGSCRLEAVPGVTEVLCGTVPAVDGSSESVAGVGQLAAAVGWDLLVEEVEAFGVVGQAAAEDVDAVGEWIIGLGAGDGDIGPMIV